MVSIIKTVRKCSLAAFGVLLAISARGVKADAASIDEVLMSGGAASFLQASHSVEEYIRYAQDAQGSLWGYTDLGICNVESGNLNVREEASTSGKMVGKMSKDAACEILDEKDGWAHIKSGEVEGYVSMDYLLTGAEAKIKAEEIVRTVAIANVDGLNVRDDADKDSHVLTQVLIGEELEFVEDEGEWIKVTLDGEDAYVASEYVTVQETLGTAITMSELLYGQGVSDLRVDICEYAKQFVGNPYVWGGSSLTKGTDCSGFTMSVYKHFGISLSHSSRAQANEGKKISASELQPGDLVFYTNSSGTINHVALYIGGGQVCHASSPKTGIKINKYNYRTPVKYVRIIND